MVTLDDLEQYLDSLSDRGLAPSTVKLASVRCELLTGTHTEGESSPLILVWISCCRLQPDEEPVTFTPDELRAILENRSYPSA